MWLFLNVFSIRYLSKWHHDNTEAVLLFINVDTASSSAPPHKIFITINTNKFLVISIIIWTFINFLHGLLEWLAVARRFWCFAVCWPPLHVTIHLGNVICNEDLPSSLLQKLINDTRLWYWHYTQRLLVFPHTFCLVIC